MDNRTDISKELFERIEKYLLDEMPDMEKLVFEEEMKGSPQLRKEVVLQGEMMLAVEAGEMKSRLETIHKKVTQKHTSPTWYLVAASIILLVSLGIWTLNRPDKAEKLFAANLTIEPGLPVPMSATNNYQFYDAMVDYKSGKYDLAISKWKALLIEHPENDTLNYFVGIALFNSEDYGQAIPYFDQVLNLNSQSFSGKSEWYSALSFLQTKEFDRLNDLASKSKSNYSDRIRELSQKVE